MSSFNSVKRWIRRTWVASRRWPSWRQALAYVGAAAIIVVTIAGIFALSFFRRDVPRVYTDVEEHFKYGSIGSEANAGIPYRIWKVLPAVFPEYLPDRPGTGYERFGFIYESAEHDLPIGTSYREKPVGLVGLTCAACHVGTIRESPEAEPRIVLGKPAQAFDLQAYIQFLFRVGGDDRFNADVLMTAIRDDDPGISRTEQLIYRYLAISRTRDALIKQSELFTWMDIRPPSGPGRVDTFNPFNEFFGLEPGRNDVVGTASLPSIWNQSVRAEMNLHWDGNNNSVDERNINAAIGAGAIKGMQDIIDLPAIKRIADWVWDDLHPVPFPEERLDRKLASQGEIVFQSSCASCHALDGKYIGQVTDIADIGTDPERLDSFTEELVVFLNKTGEGKDWKYSHFKKTTGYANMPLDGIWLRAPYLHNGSVPTLRDLLRPPGSRPTTFYFGVDLIDFENVGFVGSGEYAESNGVLFDTNLRGNGNSGHTYGVELTEAEKDSLIEFLKTM